MNMKKLVRWTMSTGIIIMSILAIYTVSTIGARMAGKRLYYDGVNYVSAGVSFLIMILLVAGTIIAIAIGIMIIAMTNEKEKRINRLNSLFNNILTMDIIFCCTSIVNSIAMYYCMEGCTQSFDKFMRNAVIASIFMGITGAFFKEIIRYATQRIKDKLLKDMADEKSQQEETSQQE